VALPAASGGPALFAKNSDRPPTEPQDLVWLPSRRDSGQVRATHIEVAPHHGPTLGVLGFQPRWCWGLEQGVNEAGVAGGNETIYTTLDPRGAPPALVGMDLVRLALERATTAVRAAAVIVEHLERYGQGGSGHRDADRPYWSSFLIADATDAWVVETSGRVYATEQVSSVRAISNRTTIPVFDAAHRHARQPVETLVDPRWEASKAVLARWPVTMERLQQHLRSHEQPGGWSVCMHVDGVEATTASMIAELAIDGSTAWCLLGSPCRSLYVPVKVGEPLGIVPPWERFAALREVDRAALDALERELAQTRLPATDAFAAVAARLDHLGH